MSARQPQRSPRSGALEANRVVDRGTRRGMTRSIRRIPGWCRPSKQGRCRLCRCATDSAFAQRLLSVSGMKEIRREQRDAREGLPRHDRDRWVGNTSFGAMYRDLDPERSAYQLGLVAFKDALEDAGLTKDDVDGIIVSRIPHYGHMCEMLGLNPEVHECAPGRGPPIWDGAPIRRDGCAHRDGGCCRLHLR